MIRSHTSRLIVYLLLLCLIAAVPACDGEPPGAEEELATAPRPTPVQEETSPSPESGHETEEPTSTPMHPSPSAQFDKWRLWVDGPHLRGANIYQRRVYPELDGTEFMGPGPLGPPYTQQDFDRLAALGANYVNISHPGLFTETPPYALDQVVQDNLDHLLDMMAQADMFAVVSFRTGPGRAEFSVCCLEEAGDWYDESHLNDAVWQDAEAQEAWAAMWRYTAERYQDNPVVAGYDLMVEPNSNEVWMDVWEPEEFYASHAGSLYDWNQLYPRITAAIREVDSNTPILVGAMAYSAVEWLPYLQPTGDPLTVYAVHQYAPVPYTHQWRDSLKLTYPGTFDTDWDGVDDQVDRAWLDELLSTVDEFVTTHDVPVAVNEFGLMRWQPGAAQFMDDQMALLEERGINHALWAWDPAWEPWTQENDAFNFRHGPDPKHHADVASSELMDVIIKYWGRNTVRPSNAIEELTTPTEADDKSVSAIETTDEAGGALAGSLIEDFEGTNLDDRWWSYTDTESTSLTCDLDQPGRDGGQAMRMSFKVNSESYASCGMDAISNQWADAGGLSFYWRADQPGLTVIVVVDMKDPMQTNPEAEGVTPFEAELQTPGAEWARVMLPWDTFAKAEWVGESGIGVLDPSRIVTIYFDVIGTQEGSVWFDDMQRMPTGALPTAPSAAAETPEATDDHPHVLDNVSHWLYLIDVNLEPETVDQIAASTYDMVVLDFITSEEDNTDYPMAQVIAKLHNASHPKLVIAYIDTGQAEEYRTYWQPGWGIGNPKWIVGSDPDGWEGNFPVAYWHDEWRQIWLGADGYLQAILDAGFDGVYLDWVEAYSDENVVAIAEEDGVDPRQEMIRWVGDIADFGRGQRPDFVVIAQNAAELAEDDGYLAIIDAIAQEQVWFDGGADNDPPGDCPLPRTEADIDTQDYRRSLSRPCRRQYDEYPDSTLHVSSEEYLSSLTLAHDKGEIIFTVDYALEPENVTWVYKTSRALGFVPFVGNRALNRYVEPVP